MISNTLSSLMAEVGRNKRGMCGVITIPLDVIDGNTDFPGEEELLAEPASVPQEMTIGDIVLPDSYPWKDISNDMRIDVEMDEEEIDGPHGKSFTYTVRFILPNDDATTRGKLIRAYDNHEHVVIVKEKTGAWRLLGSYERACDFSAQLKTGRMQEGSNQFDCGFTWSSRYRAHYVTA